MRRNVEMGKLEDGNLEFASVSKNPPDAPVSCTSSGTGLAGWILRPWSERRVRVQQQKRLRVIEQVVLGGKRQLALVVCDGQHVLVGSSEAGVQTMLLLPANGER